MGIDEGRKKEGRIRKEKIQSQYNSHARYTSQIKNALLVFSIQMHLVAHFYAL